MNFNKLIGAIAIAAAWSAFSVPAHADLINVQKTVISAVSFNDQTNTSDPDQTSFSGADLTVDFGFTGDTGTGLGQFTASVENISSAASGAIMTAIGISINDAFTETGFSFTPQGAPDCNQAPESCAFSSPGGGLNGFVTSDISADADPSGQTNGLHIGDRGLFTWDVSFADDAFDGTEGFGELFQPQNIENTKLFDGTPGTDVTAFWVAHMQSVNNFDIDNPGCVNGQTDPLCDGSLKIGGSTGSAFRTSVPEPGTLALFGIGLIGLGAIARRRRRAA